MRITRHAHLHGSLLPSAVGAIAAIPAELLHHEVHGLRHPASAYGTSLRLITAEWMRSFELLETLKRRYFLGAEDDLLMDVASAYSALLHRLHEHYDACYSVLRSLSAQTTSKPVLFHSQYLDQIKLPGWKSFQSATRAYRDGHVGLIVNAIKHAQAELCPLYFHSAREFRPGYYLRSVLPGGAMGPDPRLHQGANSAISFGRDMLMHLWWLYRTSELLTETVTAALRQLHGYTLVPRPHAMSELDWSGLLSRCAAISPEFFPDECRLPYPRVVCAPTHQALSIEFPSAAGVHRLSGEMKVRVMTTVDGAHPNEKLPYFGADALNTERTIAR